MATEKVSVVPIRVRTHDDDLAVDCSRLVGFRGVSTDGWKGPVRVVRQDAVYDTWQYRAGMRAAALRGEAEQATGAAEASDRV